MTKNIKVLILGGEKESTKILFNHLRKNFRIVKVIIEEPVDRIKFIKRRIKRLGVFKVIGQLLFQVIIVRILEANNHNRIKNLKDDLGLDSSDIPIDFTENVKSINNSATAKILENKDYDIVIVNGTRIISKKILAIISSPIINTHVGITPLYRGVHGAYWALINNDEKNCGVTVHLVDKGIDTGGVLAQANIKVESTDNFLSYPLKQLAVALPLLNSLIENFSALETIKPPEGKSKLWYHPTFWSYIYNRVVNKIK